MEKKNKSALSESGSNPSSANINPKSAKQIRNFRKNRPSPSELVNAIRNGDKTALGRAITLVESNQQKNSRIAEEVIEKAIPFSTKSIRIGITGVPGVGKSTFIESFGEHLINNGKKVAVLAVDPSSSVSHGSILGDKTRMENLVKQENAFIRPSPSGDSLGGVARKTRESIILCEAAGFDTILIETVGVGQSETSVHSMTDFFLLLKLAGAGDELQGIKRGIMEMADAIVINKADGDNLKAAREAKLDFKRALQLYPLKESGWKPKVELCSGLTGDGVPQVWKMIEAYRKHSNENGYFEKNRQEQNKFWLYETINDHLKSRFYNQEKVKKALKEQLQLIEEHKTSAFTAAKHLLSLA